MASSRYVPPPPGERIIYVRSFRHRHTGRVIRAADFGLKAFPLRVRDDDDKH